MLRKILPLCLLLPAVSCSDGKLGPDIQEIFARHSYQEHPQQEIKGLLDSGGIPSLRKLDPHAELVASARQFKRAPGGALDSSSGLLMGESGGAFVVLRAFQGSPAAMAGIRDFDKILEINGVRADAAALERGTAGEEFDLKVARRGRTPGGPLILDVKVVKRDFPFPLVFGSYDAATRTAFIRVGAFFQGSSRIIKAGLGTFGLCGCRGTEGGLRPAGQPRRTAGRGRRGAEVLRGQGRAGA